MALSLTTTFTPSAYCLTDIYKYNDTCSYDGTTTVDAYNCANWHIGPSSSNSACLPSSWSSAVSSYYHGSICPDGYEEACKTGTTGTDGSAYSQATCCPTGFTCQTGYVYPWFSTDLCTTHMSSTYVFTYTTSVEDQGWVTYASADYQGFNAFGIPIKYAAATTSASPASTAASSTATSTSTSSASPTNTGSSDSSGLSSGAKAGIGVGVGVGGAAILAAVGAILWARRRKAKKTAAAAATAPDAGNEYQQQQQPLNYKPPSSFPGTPTPYYDNATTGGAPSSYTPSTAYTPVPSELGGEMAQTRAATPGTTHFASELPVTHEGPVELPAGR